LLPGQWTRELGNKEAQIKTDGLVAKSARSDQGNCIPLFVTDSLSKKIEITDRETIRLRLVNTKGRPWKKGQKIDFSKVIFENRSKVSKVVEVLNYSIS
jgi:hypothetical protein